MARLQTSSAALTGIILISRIVSFDPTGPTKHLALQPMWQAISLCIGLSPSMANTDGMTRTGAINTQSQAHIPRSWQSLVTKNGV